MDQPVRGTSPSALVRAVDGLRAVFANTWVMLAVTLAIAGGAVVWVAHGVDWDTFADTFARMHAWPFAVVFGLICLGTLIRAVRFHILTREYGGRFVHSLETILIGYFFMMVLPLRLGELIRLGYFSRRSRTPALSTLSAVVSERTLDLIGLALVAAIVLPRIAAKQLASLPFPPWVLGAAGGAGVFGLLVVGFIARRRVGGEPADGEPAAGGPLLQLLRGMASLGSLPQAAALIALSVGLWLCVSVGVKVAFLSIDLSVPLVDAAVVMLGTCFGIALPSTPGFVGTYHGGFLAGAMLVGLPQELALPVAIVMHVVIQVPFLPIGAVVLFTGGRRALARPIETGARG